MPVLRKVVETVIRAIPDRQPDPNINRTGTVGLPVERVNGALKVRGEATFTADYQVENLAHAVSLHYMYYNFCRVQQTLKTTPAVKAGVADHVWSLTELVELLEDPSYLEIYKSN